MTLTRPTATVEIDFTTDLSAGLSYWEQIAATGPYVWYKLLETTGTSHTDASGNGVTGTGSGLTLNQTAGKPVTGEAASRYVNFGNRISFAPPSLAGDRLTIEAWVYRATLDGNAATHYYIFAGNNGVALSFHVKGDGRLKFSAYPSTLLSTDNYITTNAVITAATWYHVAVTVDGPNNDVQFYVNGAAVATTNNNPLSSFFINTPSTAYWGTNLTGGATPISRIAEPALYLDVLDGGTISDHYNAAATSAFSDYTWTDVSSYLDDTEDVTRRFGRESELEDVTPMEVTFTLLNKDRRFEPEYASSPYYPNVVPGRPVRVRMVQNSVTYDWAFGFIQDFPQEYPLGALHGRVPVVARCFLERMNNDTLGTRGFLQHLAGTRINMIANIAGVPTARRAHDAGANQIMALVVNGGSTGDHGRAVARSDRGIYFFNGAGYSVFQDGTYRTTNTRSTVSQGTLGLGAIEYTNPAFHSPASLIRNYVSLRRPGGVEQVAQDGTSRAKYGLRAYPDELLLSTDAAIATRASALLADYKDPTLRVRSVTFNPQTGTGQWEHALGVRLSDRYSWVFDPLQGTTLTRPVFVEGVFDVYNFRAGEYLATWFLSLV